MRKLASCQRISALTPIEGADMIECASILGWKVIVKKGDFKVNELCVYFEVDSILPEVEQFEFMRHYKFRLRTIKMKGQVSQGLAIPLTFIAEEGADLTLHFGVTKYEPPVIEMVGNMKAYGAFPSDVPKTDEERIQSNPHLMVPGRYFVTEKVDGSSVTLRHTQGETQVCSRNITMREDDESLFTLTTKKIGAWEAIKTLGMNVAFQGEMVGPKIQSNRLCLKETDILWYNMFDIGKQMYLPQDKSFEIYYNLGQKFVPMFCSSFQITESTTVEELEQMADCNSFFGDFPCEGLVFRSLERENFSFKVINKNYLLKHKI